MTCNAQYVGVDVAKDRLDYTLDGRTAAHVANTAEGHAQLLAVLQRVPDVRVVCEASGGYERAFVAALLLAGVEVCVVQPGRVRAFAHAHGILAKTDHLDACVLRRFGADVKPRLSVLKDQAAMALRELLEHRRQLSELLVATGNRLLLAGPTLRPLLESQQNYLQGEMEKVDRMIREHIEQDPELGPKAKRLRQLQGVGPVLAATLLAYLPELGQVDAPRIAALVGVAPYARDSGDTHGPRHIRGGREIIRHVLYMGALTAARANPILKAFYRRLRATGKPPVKCLVAVMRKMLCVLNKLIADPDFRLAH